MGRVFPSPCGDVFLKFNDVPMKGVIIMTVSVPLRGCGFEIYHGKDEASLHEPVSVPLRGCGFEMNATPHTINIFVFPSLYGDDVL